MSATKKAQDTAAQDAIEGRTQPRGAKPRHSEPAPLPSAGPHADPALANPDATPGAGTLPEPGEDDGMESTSS